MKKEYRAQAFVNFRCPACHSIMRNFENYMQCKNHRCELHLARWEHVTFKLVLYEQKEPQEKV
jgi:hypothetical protein